MANQEFHYFKGKCKWAKLITPDTKFEPLGVWSIQLYPDAESLEKIKALKQQSPSGVGGILNTVKKDEDGEYVQFKRKAQKVIKGQVKAFAPPEIMDAEGKPLPGTRIGNGSDVTCKVEVYQYSNPLKVRGRAARLCAVRIDNLVPFEKDSYTDEEAKLASGLAEQPEHLF